MRAGGKLVISNFCRGYFRYNALCQIPSSSKHNVEANRKSHETKWSTGRHVVLAGDNIVLMPRWKSHVDVNPSQLLSFFLFKAVKDFSFLFHRRLRKAESVLKNRVHFYVFFFLAGDCRTSPEKLFLAGNYGVSDGRLRCRYGLCTLTVSGFPKRKRLYLAEFRSYSIFCLEN